MVRFFFRLKIGILLFLPIFIYMRPKLPEYKKRVKISITLSKDINDKVEKDIINKSKLIEKLLKKYYDESV
jgi:hypothetical protein